MRILAVYSFLKRKAFESRRWNRAWEFFVLVARQRLANERIRPIIGAILAERGTRRTSRSKSVITTSTEEVITSREYNGVGSGVIPAEGIGDTEFFAHVARLPSENRVYVVTDHP